MAHVLVKNNAVVKTINGVRPLTTGESSNGGVRYEVNPGVDIVIGGRVTLDSGKVSAISNPNALSVAGLRQLEVKEFLRQAERVPVANWGLAGSAETGKAVNNWKWLEMIGAHASKAANVTDNARWAKIRFEMSLGVEWFYNNQNASSWDTLSIAALAATFYSTDSQGRAVAQVGFDGYTGRNNDVWEGLASWIH